MILVLLIYFTEILDIQDDQQTDPPGDVGLLYI